MNLCNLVTWISKKVPKELIVIKMTKETNMGTAECIINSIHINSFEPAEKNYLVSLNTDILVPAQSETSTGHEDSGWKLRLLLKKYSNT